MKYLLFVTLSLVIVFGCSGDSTGVAGQAAPTAPCASENTGTWSGIDVSDQITFGSDCAFDYIGIDGCQSTGTFNAPLGTMGTVQVEITAATIGLCLPAGSYTCVYLLDNGLLGFDCGAGAWTYRK